MKADVDTGTASVDSAARVLALAQKVHDEYVAAGQDTREKLISEGQSRHDQVVAEANARQEQLLSTGRAKYDEHVSSGKAKHDALIAEAEAPVAEAQPKKGQILKKLDRERGVLRKEIEELRACERDHRARQKASVEGRLAALEQTDAVENG